MIYFTSYLEESEKNKLITHTPAVPLPNNRLYEQDHCLILTSYNNLYYIYPSKNEPYNQNACGCIGSYKYNSSGQKTEEGEIDIFEHAKENIWEHITFAPKIIITDVILNNPENLLANNLQSDYPEVYNALKALNIITDQNIIAENIKKAMQLNGLKQKELAEKTKLTEVAISRYINDERIPNANNLAKIANALHVSTDYLLGIEKQDFETEYSTILRLIVKNAQAMTMQQKKNIIKLLLN